MKRQDDGNRGRNPPDQQNAAAEKQMAGSVMFPRSSRDPVKEMPGLIQELKR
jgi:hypothetical protein